MPSAQRTSKRVRLPARPPSPPSPPKQKRAIQATLPSKRQHGGGAARLPAKRQHGGGDNAARQLKRQLREQSKELEKMQAMILHNHSLLVARGIYTGGAAQLPQMPFATTGAAAPPPLPPAMRGEMSFAARRVLKSRLERLRGDVLVRALDTVGGADESGDVDLQGMDSARLWSLHDFCEAAATKRPAKPAARRPRTGAPRRAERLPAERAAITSQLEEVRAARAALAAEATSSEAASTYDAAESERDSALEDAALEDWEFDGWGEEAGEEAADALLMQLEGEDYS